MDCLIKLFLLLLAVKEFICIQFSFISPSPHITILQSAVYQCTVTDVGQNDSVTVRWRVNDNSSTTDDWSLFISTTGITQTGTDTASILTIPGDTTNTLNDVPAYTVQCIASGIVDGNGYYNISSHTLYIQGPPLPVGSLQSVHIPLFTIYSNWSIPYTIMGISITGYNINITSNSILVHQSFVTNSTEYYYNVSQFGVYNISVIAVISDLEGDSNTVLVIVPEVTKIVNSSIELFYTDGNWIGQCIIRDPQLSNPLPTHLIVTILPSLITYNTTNITITNNAVIIGEIILYTVENNQLINVTITIEYNNGVNITTDPIEISTSYGIQHFSIISTTNGLCCQCSFITSNTQGCFIVYTSIITMYNGNYTISISDQQQCIYNIYTSQYNITVYNIDTDGTIRIDQPVPFGTFDNISVTVMKDSTSLNMIASTPATDITSVTVTAPTTFVIPTTTDIDTVKSPTNNDGLIAGVSSTLIIVMIVIIIVTVLLLVIYKYRRSNSTKKPRTNENNYIESQPVNSTNNNTEWRPLEQQPLHEEYSTLNHNPRHVVTNNSSEYHRLDHNNPTGQFTSITIATGEYSTIQLNSFTDNKPEYSTLSDQVFCKQQKQQKPELSYKFIINNIGLQIAHRWEEFGKHLRINNNTLLEIKENHPNNNSNAFGDMVNEWQTTQTRSFTWTTLDMVLTIMRETTLLNNIKANTQL